MAEAIDEYDAESVILEDGSNAVDSEPEGPYMNELLADYNWITEYSRDAQEVKQSNRALQSSSSSSSFIVKIRLAFVRPAS